jgi:hypothetical protein
MPTRPVNPRKHYVETIIFTFVWRMKKMTTSIGCDVYEHRKTLGELPSEIWEAQCGQGGSLRLRLSRFASEQGVGCYVAMTLPTPPPLRPTWRFL